MINEAIFDNKTYRFKLSKTVPLTGEKLAVIDNVEKLFQALKYNDISRYDSSIILTNGNEEKNGWHNNPLKWYNRINFNFTQNETIIDFEWSIKNQVLTSNEKDFIDSFINEIINDLKTNSITIDKYIELTSKTKSKGIKMTLWIIVGAFLSAIPSVYLAFKFDLIIIMFLGILLGTFTSYKLILKWMSDD